jgi:nucleoside-diphosphate-sugar epimerase
MIQALVLGGTGFLGRNILESLHSHGGYKLTTTHYKREPWEDKNFEWIQADLTNRRDVQKVFGEYGHFDVVIQAAASTSGILDTFARPDFHVTDNAVMNALILREVNAAKIPKFVFFSCTTMLQSSITPQSELAFDPMRGPIEKYFGVGWTKVYIEKLCEFYSKLGNTSFAIIRHSNVYGPWDRHLPKNSHVCGATITKVLRARDSVEIWGPGTESRDLLFVDDLCELVERICSTNHDTLCLINAGGGSSVSINKLTEMIIQLANKNLKLIHNMNKPHLDFSVVLDNSRAKELFLWDPRTSLEDGLTKTISFWIKNYDLDSVDD